MEIQHPYQKAIQKTCTREFHSVGVRRLVAISVSARSSESFSKELGSIRPFTRIFFNITEVSGASFWSPLKHVAQDLFIYLFLCLL